MAESLPPGSILACFAVAAEAGPFIRWSAGHDALRVLITGMGQRRAQRTLQDHLREHRPRLILSCGFAGGLNPNTESGTPLFEIHEIPGTWAEPGLPVLESPTGVALPPDAERFAARLRENGIREGRFHTTDRVLVTPAEKARLREATGADAVDMESAALASVAATQHIPFAIVRVISDTATEDLPVDFNRFVGPDGDLRYPQLVLHLLSHPRALARVLAFNRTVRHAARNLAAALTSALIP